MSDYLDFPIYSTGSLQRINVQAVLHHQKSSFQDILLIDTPEFGRCLILDGIMQSAESDHNLYDAALLAQLSSEDKEILIVGGGDGWVTANALRMAPEARITVLEIDGSVVAAACDVFETQAFDDPRVHLILHDALTLLEEWSETDQFRFDGIAVDLTDNPNGEESLRSFEEFHRRAIRAYYKILNDRGWVSMQAGAADPKPPYFDAARFLEAELRRSFRKINRADILIPSFGEKLAFLYAQPSVTELILS